MNERQTREMGQSYLADLLLLLRCEVVDDVEGLEWTMDIRFRFG